MSRPVPHPVLRTAVAFLTLAVLLLCGCYDREAVTEQYFVGKWKSSRLTTPVYLYANGEWEIKTEDGDILQFGVWEYKGGKLVWSYKMGEYIGHDANLILSAMPREFKLQENDLTTTTFSKLD